MDAFIGSSTKDRYDLYLAYEEEMSQFFYPNHHLESMEKRMEHVSHFINTPTHLWYDIACRGKIVGFFIICITKDNCHPDYDITILDAYIAPKYRRQHFFSNTIVEFVKANPGKYALITFRHNTLAKKVMDNVFVNRLNYHPSQPRFIPHSRDFNTTLIGYSKTMPRSK